MTTQNHLHLTVDADNEFTIADLVQRSFELWGEEVRLCDIQIHPSKMRVYTLLDCDERPEYTNVLTLKKTSSQ